MAEPPRSREAFDCYWQLGAGRSIERLRVELELEGRAPTLRTLYEWSRRYHWQQRIAELEREAAAADHARHLREAREMNERQLREGLLLQQRGTEWLARLDAERVSASEATRAIVDGARLERDARGAGAPGDEVSPRHDFVRDQLAEMTDEQLRQLMEQMREAERER